LERFHCTFYALWFDKILNFDNYAIKELFPNILNSNECATLIESINDLAKIERELDNTLANDTRDISQKLDEFISLQKSERVVTYNNITESLEHHIKKMEELGSAYEEISSKIENSLGHLIGVSDQKKLEINAINKNSASLNDLKKLFSSFRGKAMDSEITHLKEVSDILSSSINNTYASLEISINTSKDKLSAFFEYFYEICNRFTQSFSETLNETLPKTLNDLNLNIHQTYEKFDKQIQLLEEAIKSTNNSTQEICKILFNFSQFTNSPLFMEKIKGSDFQNALVNASLNLVSYQKLVESYDQYKKGNK
jgi:hypothetical protein